jgi:telomere length regulation protein
MDTSIEVRTVISGAKKQIIACKSAQELSDIIQQFVHLLDSKSSKDSLQKQPVSSCSIRYSVEFRKEFISRHYSSFCEHILTHGDPRFLKDEKLVLTRLLLDGPAEKSLLALVSAIETVVHTEKLHLIVSILDDFASNGKFTELFISQCLVESAKIHTQELLTVVTSLPDKLANKMKLALNGKFHPNIYYTMLAKEIIKAIIEIHDIACKTTDYSTSFLSNIIGKISLRGSAAILFDVMLPQFKEWCYTSPLWSNICSMLFLQIPESALESVIECLLNKITFFPFFGKILKDGVLSNAVIKHLMTHKFLLVRYYNNPNVLQNIVGYLCADTRRAVLVDVLKTILAHWSNTNTVKHSSYEQHFYVTQAIILATIQLNSSEISAHKNDLLHKMLSGVEVHLGNPNNKIRQLGMVTAECMTACLHPDSQKLKFDIEPDDDVKKLRALAALPKFDSHFEKQNFLNKENVVENGFKKKPDSSGTPSVNGTTNEKALLNDNDDDEDLEPYEMSEDDNDLVEGIHPPRYISQCIDGLLASDDPKRHIASLHVLTKVIKSDQDNLSHQSVQLVTILLHLQDKYSLDSYTMLRFSAMVEVTVRCPIQVAGYLTKEFYAQNYSLRQRMDILDVLTTAAGKLSKPSSREASSSQVNNEVSSEFANDKATAKNWRTVVQERINKKTRRFSKKSSIVSPNASANKFGSVAGHFFFPLLQGFDDRQNTFDLLGDDCMVLGSLTCTLGNIMYCSRGLPISQNMAKSLLEFVWVLRYHNDAHVRQGLLFSLAMVVVSMPAFFLMTEVQNELAECQQWLENLLHNDPSNECRELALQILVSIRDTFQKHFNSDGST